MADEGGGRGGDGEEEMREGGRGGSWGVGSRSQSSREDGPDEADVGELKVSSLRGEKRRVVSRGSREDEEEREDEEGRRTLSEQIVSTIATMV